MKQLYIELIVSYDNYKITAFSMPVFTIFHHIDVDIYFLQLLGGHPPTPLLEPYLPVTNPYGQRTDRFFVVNKKSEWKSVRVRWLLLRYKIAPIFARNCLRQKIGLCALTFGLAATKSRSCALTQSEKKSDLHSDFLSELLTTKNRSVCAGHNRGCHLCDTINVDIVC